MQNGLSGKVLITGGSGFIGRAILRQAAEGGMDAEFTVLSRDEAKLIEVRRRFDVRTVLGDVRDYGSLQSAFAGHDVVIHAAAMKHIPAAEIQVEETLTVNVDGTRNVAAAAIAAGVRKVVGISTDKACEPVNLYGMTKAVLEKVFQEAAAMDTGTDFALVRYGNVVGSTGSVVPLWKRQALEDGEITVTDPNITRFWMSPREAVAGILKAYSDGSRGYCWIPACSAMSLDALAETVARGAKQRLIGLRPGERLHEQLLGHQESYWATGSAEYQPPGDGPGFWPGFWLRPMTTEPANPLPAAPYTSETARALTPDEFVEMMQDGEGV